MNSEEVDQARRIDVDALPPAVQRWLGRALPDGRATPAGYQIEQEGSTDDTLLAMVDERADSDTGFGSKPGVSHRVNECHVGAMKNGHRIHRDYGS